MSLLKIYFRSLYYYFECNCIINIIETHAIIKPTSSFPEDSMTPQIGSASVAGETPSTSHFEVM